MENWKIIKDEEEYQKVLIRIDELIDSEQNTPEGEELDLLALLVEHYEETNFPIPDPDPIDVIKYYIEMRGMKTRDLANIIGDETLVSRVLNKETELNIGMIKNLHDQMNIPYSLLLRD